MEEKKQPKEWQNMTPRERFIAALERKETRGTHIHTDFPFPNPLMEKLLVIKRVDDKPVVEWREIKH